MLLCTQALGTKPRASNQRYNSVAQENNTSVVLGGKEYFWVLKDRTAPSGEIIWQRTLETDLATFKYNTGRVFVIMPKHLFGTFRTGQPDYKTMDDINNEVITTYNRLADGEVL